MRNIVYEIFKRNQCIFEIIFLWIIFAVIIFSVTYVFCKLLPSEDLIECSGSYVKYLIYYINKMKILFSGV